MKRIYVLLWIVLNFSVYSQVKFGKCATNAVGDIVFTMAVPLQKSTISTLFLGKINADDKVSNMELITPYPAGSQVLIDGSIQLSSNMGTALIGTNKSLTTKRIFTSPEKASAAYFPVATSPDGRYICQMQKTGFTTGDVVLYDLDKKKSTILQKDCFLDYKRQCALWCSNGLLLYENNGVIYFTNPAVNLKGAEIPECYRKIGNGTMSTIAMAGDDIVYLDRDTVYKISSKALYTVSLYGELIGVGRAIGRLTTSFNMTRDHFFVDPTLKNLVVISDNTFTLYKIEQDNATTRNFSSTVASNFASSMKVVSQKTLTNNAGLILDASAFFSVDENQNDKVTAYLWLRSLSFNGKVPMVHIYNMSAKFEPVLTVENSYSPYLSQNTALCAIPCGKSLYIYDTVNWARGWTIEGDTWVAAAWVNERTFYALGENIIKKYTLGPPNTFATGEFVCPASASKIEFADSSKVVVSSDNSTRYTYDLATKIWHVATDNDIEVPAKKQHRVFISNTSNTFYKNALYVRTLATNLSWPVFPQSTIKTAKPKRVALIFDCYDDVAGLNHVLHTLETTNSYATFFLNGEFIRRYPNQTKLLSNLEYECASMFFTKINLASKSYNIDEEFIRKGLSRCEDEYLSVTGKELSLLWHAPYYIASDEIIEYGKSAGYSYLASPNYVDDGDNRIYMSLKRIVNIFMKIIDSHDAVIIPITIGNIDKNGTITTQPILDNLDVFLNSIKSSGCSIVNVRELLD